MTRIPELPAFVAFVCAKIGGIFEALVPQAFLAEKPRRFF
jgi:hypothetical protein